MEQWKMITTHPKYEVSDLGNVRNIKTQRILKGRNNMRGYLYVVLDKKDVAIHRLVACEFCDNPNGLNMVDHINRDKLDNKATNLRFVTGSQNSQNKTKQANTSSKYSGVSYDKNKCKWQARIRIEGKQKFLGYYEKERHAGRAYDRIALENYGQFCKLNFPLSDYIK